jgi:hypothetical protein
LEGTDIPKSRETFKHLWVQRFQLDPAQALLEYNGPFLSILGEEDPIVPYTIQQARFDSIFKQAGKTNYELKSIPKGNHGLTQGSAVRSFACNLQLGSTPYYYKFCCVGVLPLIHAITFFKENGFLEKSRLILTLV